MGRPLGVKNGQGKQHVGNRTVSAGNTSAESSGIGESETGGESDGIIGEQGLYLDPSELNGGEFGTTGTTGGETGGDKDTSTRRRGGRPKGSYNKASNKKKISDSVEGLARILSGLNMGLAALTGCPELNVDQKETEELARNAAHVASFYDLEASEKTMAWIALLVCFAMIYVPRILAIKMRVETEAEEKRKKAVQF